METEIIATVEARRQIVILATGHVLPGDAVSSEELDLRFNYPLGTIEQMSGVRSRHFAKATETAAELAAQAAHQALASANLKLTDIDCLISASGTMDQGMPCNAALIHQALGLSSTGIPAFDINASCLSFLVAIDTISWSMLAGRFRRVLIVGADIASCGLDWSKLEASAIFGDGAAAIILGTEQAGHSCILAADLMTISEGADLCSIPAGGSRHHPSKSGEAIQSLAMFRMDGKRLFKRVSQHAPAFVERLMQNSGLTLADIDWVVLHQASQLGMAHIAKILGLPTEKVINIFPNHGNQVATSLPTTLDVGIKDGRIRRGHRILMFGTGAGLSLGGMVFVY